MPIVMLHARNREDEVANDDQEILEHEPSAWTVGQLRLELEGLPEGMELRVWVAEQPGGELVDEQVVVSAGFGTYTPGGRDAEERVDPVVSISCEFPAGKYYRRKRT
jgi:hypothetical protein